MSAVARTYWIVRPNDAKEDFDHYLYLTGEEAHAEARRMVAVGRCKKAYVEVCERLVYSVVK